MTRCGVRAGGGIDLMGQSGHVVRKSGKEFPLFPICGMRADPPAFRRIGCQLVPKGLHVLHSGLPWLSEALLGR
jgi:hypothetical protein